MVLFEQFDNASTNLHGLHPFSFQIIIVSLKNPRPKRKGRYLPLKSSKSKLVHDPFFSKARIGNDEMNMPASQVDPLCLTLCQFANNKTLQMPLIFDSAHKTTCT